MRFYNSQKFAAEMVDLTTIHRHSNREDFLMYWRHAHIALIALNRGFPPSYISEVLSALKIAG